MNLAIKHEVERRGITRICHFTPSRNLAHIATGEVGLLATKNLKADERNLFTATDLSRWDGHEGFICCSIQYPNAWYFDLAQARDTLFRDWVVLLIDPKYLWASGTKFCPRNAAGSGGSGIAEGEAAFLGMYSNSVRGAGNISRSRRSSQLASCPTDQQAEVLIHDRIPLVDVNSVVVASEAQARNEAARFRSLGVPQYRFSWVISPTFFDKHELSQCIQSGKLPAEVAWHPSVD